MGTESSVVVALREVRRLEVERQRREEASRLRAHEERVQAETRRATMEHARVSGGYPVQGHYPNPANAGWPGQQDDQDVQGGGYGGHVRRTAEVLPFPGQGRDMPGAARGWDPAYGEARAPRKSSAFATFFVTVLLCAGGAAGGWWKLDQDFRHKLVNVQADNRRLETARQDAVEADAKIQQELKLRIATLESRLAVAGAKAAAAERATLAATLQSAPSQAMPAIIAKADRRGSARASAKGKRTLAHAGVERPASKASRAATAKADTIPDEKPFVAPKIQKKVMADDPLGGIVLPSKAM